ncbi:hypothetical protein DXV75_14550 [Alteromonas aestuariivivens]|uniref:Uncharacterized protein n=1 Tax=Alteromonas aestuariivivens TaxID=1938339 RepID=A0A3D8M3V6_9ALTE|nr:hypothetical protein [Alteromonas aestuariivivens]RDV24235.1 hypothetical protein DXV75_14550 [Alteromonas aestuariivivens]
MIFTFPPIKIFKLHITIIGLLLLANIAGIVIEHMLHIGALDHLVKLFNFNTESNVPTLFSSFMLIVCSIVLCFITVGSKKSNAAYLPWLGLSLIFLYLSIDEIYSIHERFTGLARMYFEPKGILYYTWVVPYALLLLIFVFTYSKFLLNLPRKIMGLFIFSGFIFVSGALGFELLGGKQHDSMGKDNLLYSLFYTCEELLEMLGVAVFLYSLLLYIIEEFKSLNITVADKLQSPQLNG